MHGSMHQTTLYTMATKSNAVRLRVEQVEVMLYTHFGSSSCGVIKQIELKRNQKTQRNDPET